MHERHEKSDIKYEFDPRIDFSAAVHQVLPLSFQVLGPSRSTLLPASSLRQSSMETTQISHFPPPRVLKGWNRASRTPSVSNCKAENKKKTLADGKGLCCLPEVGFKGCLLGVIFL